MTFDRGGTSMPKRTIGATGENLKVEPSSFLGSGPSSCCKEINGIREGVRQNHEEVLN
jgi:hypothetical protein